MESKTISALSVDRVKGIASSALLKFFGNDPQRLKIYQGGNRLNFCCPYCGDSKDAKKKRGNLYVDTLTYKCYNGGCAVFKNLNQFTRDFEINGMLSSDEIAEIAEIACSPPVFIRGFVGKNGTNCGATQIGPTPGPPPP